jgi:hypothetical protein
LYGCSYDRIELNVVFVVHHTVACWVEFQIAIVN